MKRRVNSGTVSDERSGTMKHTTGTAASAGTVAEAKVTGKVIAAALIATLGGLQFGYGTGAINTPQTTIERNLGVTSSVFSLANVLFAIGGLVGAQTAGGLADKFGRKAFQCVYGILFVVAGVLMFLAGEPSIYTDSPKLCFGLLLSGRILVGLGSGAATVVVPMYLNEIAPRNMRGAFGISNQFAIVVGILGAQVIGIGWSGDTTWRWLLGLTVCIGALQLILSPFLPKSPK